MVAAGRTGDGSGQRHAQGSADPGRRSRPGRSEGQRERIFDPFHRLDSSGGAGLGLAIARGFAEANGGRLWVESRSGQGASFALALPAVEAPVEVTG